MRPGTRPYVLHWLMLALLLSAAVCQKDEAPPRQEPPLDLNAEMQRGWALFRNHQYDEAETAFRRLVVQFPEEADPLVGRGWCEIQADSLTLAIEILESALEIDDDRDALAGVVVAASALGLDTLAVSAAYEITDATYLFVGDPNLGFERIVYLRALGEFHLRRWQDCYNSLLIIASWLEIDLTDYDFREQLMAALERLRDT